jgi:hypothetical protein
MFTRQVPASAILLDAQSMTSREMPSKDLAAPAAFEANHVIAMNGSADRHGRSLLSLGLRCRFAEADERVMDGRD